jgi:RsiW-degrading membrane proteinase PrsW (M82 family)
MAHWRPFPVSSGVTDEERISMRDLARMTAYTTGAIAVIFFMIWLTRQKGLSDNFMVVVAVLLTIIIPVALGVIFARRERQQRERDSKS